MNLQCLKVTVKVSVDKEYACFVTFTSAHTVNSSHRIRLSKQSECNENGQSGLSLQRDSQHIAINLSNSATSLVSIGDSASCVLVSFLN